MRAANDLETRVRELLERATARPWTATLDSCAQCERNKTAEYDITAPPGYHAALSEKADADLIVVAVNTLPTAFELARATEKFHDLEMHEYLYKDCEAETCRLARKFIQDVEENLNAK